MKDLNNFTKEELISCIQDFQESISEIENACNEHLRESAVARGYHMIDGEVQWRPEERDCDKIVDQIRKSINKWIHKNE
jgi:predicted HicB family RNase H-like nuclease